MSVFLKNLIFNILFFIILSVSTLLILEIALKEFNKYYHAKIFNCPDGCLKKKKELIESLNKKENFVVEDTLTYFKKILKTSADNKNNIVIAVPPLRNASKANEIYPLSGISNSRTIYCNELGFYNEYNSDKFGFNNLNHEYNKPVDYLLIGDSQLHGGCVKNTDNIKGNLIRLSKKEINFLNLGYQGTGPLHQYAILREYFEIIKPKKVLLFYVEANDLAEISEEMSLPQLKNYFLNDKYSQNLIKKVDIADQILISLHDKKFKEKNSHKNLVKKENVIFKNLVSIIKLQQIRSFFRLKKIENNNLNSFSSIIKKMKYFLDQKNTQLIFIYLPDYQRYKGNMDNKYKKYEQIINIVEENNIKIIDVKKNVFDTHPDPLSLFPFRLNGHYNEKGNKIVSEFIYKNLFN